jgi:hypothetical protein
MNSLIRWNFIPCFLHARTTVVKELLNSNCKKAGCATPAPISTRVPPVETYVIGQFVVVCLFVC